MIRSRQDRRTVLIVDDNPYVGQSLVSSIAWNDLGFRVCSVARNGGEALALLRSERPDVLLTDIRMPGISGLELAVAAQSIIDGVQIIVFTGYDEFSYAREALRIGAVDVILKPLRNVDVENALRRAGANLDGRGKDRSNEAAILERLTTAVVDARRKIVADLIHGYISGEDDAQAKARAVDYPVRRYQLLLGAIFGPLRAPSKYYDRISAFARSEEVSTGSRFVGVIIEGRPVCIVDVEQFGADIDRRGCLRRWAGNMRSAVGEPALRVAASGAHTRLSSMKSAYSEAQLMVARFFIEPESRLAEFEDHNASLVPDEARLQALLERLARLVEGAGGESHEIGAQVRRQAKTLFREISAHASFGLGNLERLILHVYERLGIHRERSRDVVWREAPGLPWPSLEAARDELVARLLDSRRHANVENDIQDWHARRMIEFIENNYAQNISLASVADDLKLSAGYVSRLARRATGRTFTELVTATRIERAKELLRHTDAKVYQIADLVGISNYAYFFQLFRKMTGMAPDDYRAAPGTITDNIPNKTSPF